MSSSPHPAEYYTPSLRQLVSTAEAAAKVAEVAQLEAPTVQGIAGGGAAAGKREIIERIIRAETERLEEEAENVGREAERAAAETERLRSETERKKVEIEFEKVKDKDLDSSARVAHGMSFKEEAERLQADTEGRKTEKERKLPEIKTVGRKDLTGSARVMRRLPFQEGGGLVAEAEPKKLKTEIAGGKDSADPTLEAQRICFKKQGEGLKADMERMKVDAENLNNEVKKVAQVWERERMGIATLFAEFNAREKARDEKLKAGLDRLLDEMEQLRSGTHRKLKQNDPKIVEGVRAEAEKVGQERW